jgi:hypothetical protein
MQTQAHFQNIAQVIAQELEQAKSSIHIAVAWFTDRQLFEIICQKSSAGVPVYLMLVDDSINRESSINFTRLEHSGGRVFRLSEERLMHNKFCIVDRSVVISGSYNWSNKAKQNYENITVVKESFEFAMQFLREYNQIIKSSFGIDLEIKEGKDDDIGKVIKRLEVIEKLIQLDDLEDIDYQIKKLHQLELPGEVDPIIESIAQRAYGAAAQKIGAFISAFSQLVHYIDPQLQGLKTEIRLLEVEIATFSSEKAEIDKLIQDYSLRHNREVGKTISELLRLQKILLKKEAAENANKQAEYEEAERDYEAYHQQYEESKKQTQQELNTAELGQLKKAYREAALLCHPDKVHESMKNQAQETFLDLQNAYQQNDLKKIEKILHQLKTSFNFASVADKVNEKQQLLAEVTRLRLILDQLRLELNELKSDESYITVKGIKDWATHFEALKVKLHRQLEKYQALFIES